jgi:hypothetical protein
MANPYPTRGIAASEKRYVEEYFRHSTFSYGILPTRCGRSRLRRRSSDAISAATSSKGATTLSRGRIALSNVPFHGSADLTWMESPSSIYTAEPVQSLNQPPFLTINCRMIDRPTPRFLVCSGSASC